MSTKNAATVALYSIDPIALDAFHSFDPESFSLIPLINDALVIIGLDGEVVPGLAVSWKQVSPVETDFELRQGVTFHNGETMTADDVVATFAAHRGPTPSACGAGILSPIVNVEKTGEYSVRMTTAFPDGMLLRRLFFGQVYPKSVLETDGRDAFMAHPIGTGAYEFVHWKKGEEILLRRRADHWAGEASVDELRFPILRQKEWTERLEKGDIDIALNADSHQVTRVERIDGLHSKSRDAALSQWFLLSNEGPLADVRVRRALNHAINRPLLVDITEHGHGHAQRTVATAEQEGFNPDVAGYRYSPALAKSMLAEAGYPDGFTLKGLVSETSTTLFSTVREFLSRVGVHLEAEVVPRAEWIGRVVVGKLTGNPYKGNFAVASVDNPLLHSLFHQFIFLFKDGPFSLTTDDDYDNAFLKAATEVDPEKMLAAQQELEAFTRDQALMLFTVQQKVHMIARDGFDVKLPRSGHFDAAAVWSLTKDDAVATSGAVNKDHCLEGEKGRLLDATSHLGLFHLTGEEPLDDPELHTIWRNIRASEDRWHLQMEPMVRELVSLSDARSNLDNVLHSTNRVAIVGISAEGDQAFENAGYKHMFGDDGANVTTMLGQVPGELSWDALKDEVAQNQSWAGPVRLPTEGRPAGAPPKLYLTITAALDQDGNVDGHTLVFSDFSGEEERIRSGAVRVILDHVANGLFRTGADGEVLEGYSDSCNRLLKLDRDMTGQKLVDVLRLGERDAGHFGSCLIQVFDDFLPEDVTVGQLPKQVELGGSIISLDCSVIRDDTQNISSLLWTVGDITQLIEAERDAQRQKGIVQVLRFKDRFTDFARQLLEDLTTLRAKGADAAAHKNFDKNARMLLHTAKGVFGQFSLFDIASFIHEVEDSTHISVSQLQELATRIDQLIDDNHDVWGIKLQDTGGSLDVTPADLEAFKAAVESAHDEDELRSLALSFVRDVSRKTVDAFIGPMAESARQHSAARNKDVELVVKGGDTRAPTALAPVFGSITHLVRNAIDHGIEERGGRGDKPEQAVIELAVEEADDGLRISLTDDGQGVHGDRVVEKALAAGVVSADEAANLSDEEKCMLIFADGLSTADSITETSGRGVGMAAVKDSVEQMGGEVHLDTTIGRGTKVTLYFSSDAMRDWDKDNSKVA